jgi:hypothetical protein
VTVALEEYFGHVYPTADYLLLASCSRLFRMEPDRSILWKTELLGLDGVVVRESGPTLVRGDGEWDPPGGWRPFAVLAADGRRVSQASVLPQPAVAAAGRVGRSAALASAAERQYR